MSYLVDSCILIDHLLGSPEATGFLRDAATPAISQITWIEIMVGAGDPDTELSLRALLSGFEVLPIDQAVSEEAVRIRRSRRLKLPDAIILATALVHGRTLATTNTRDFPPGDTNVMTPYSLGAPA